LSLEARWHAAPITAAREVEKQNMAKTGRHGSLGRALTVSALAIGLCTAFASSAKAACPSPVRPRVSGVGWTDGPRAGMPGRHQGSLVYASFDNQEREREPSIVGLWKVDVSVDGQVIDQGFDAWHADGTETLNDSVPPTTGNVCLGVWEKTGNRTYKLKHLSWNYDANGTAIGIVIIRQLVRLNRAGNAYQGTFTFGVYDLNETLLFQDTGKLSATRITAD
jgi:hypothetical protein